MQQNDVVPLVADMTLRDLFAGMALVGVLAFSPDECEQMDAEMAAEVAYEAAAAMLAERAKGGA